MSFWLPPSAPWPLGPGVRRENDERDRRQTRPLSSFSGSSTLPFVSPAKAGAQEPRWGRCHGAGPSAAGFPPASCTNSCKTTLPAVLRWLWWFNVLLLATQGSAVPGSRRSPGRRRVSFPEATAYCRGSDHHHGWNSNSKQGRLDAQPALCGDNGVSCDGERG